MIKNNNILIAQGGGPTAVINQTLVGIIQAEKKLNSKVYGSLNGVNGIINNKIMTLVQSITECKRICISMTFY